MTNHIRDYEKALKKQAQAFAEMEKVLDELDILLKGMRIFLKKWRKQCQKSGKKK